MVYRLGQRSRRRFNRVRLLGLLAGSVALVGLVTVSGDYNDGTSALVRQVWHGTDKRTPQATGKPSGKAALTGSKPKKAGKTVSTPIHKPAAPAVATTTAPVTAAAAAVQSQNCGDAPAAHAGLSASSNPELRKLAQYEQLCGSAVVQRSSFFTSTPTTLSEASSAAADIAGRLKAYAGYGIAPLVFMEPTDNGDTVDLTAYKNGSYDGALAAYYNDLKANGVTDAMMGTWVLLPEGNIPVWSSLDPTTYAAVVTKTAQLQKQYFPGSQTAIMLDSESYAPGAGWGNGMYVSWLPFIQGIPRGLIDSVGLQGFPWASPANQADNSVYDPAVYLRTSFLTEAARSLGTDNVWFNTGTFGQAYTQTPSQLVTVTDDQRLQMLEGVISQAKALENQGFTVAIHVFAQNKAQVSEAIDWSYWPNVSGQPVGSASAVFTSFAHQAQSAGIPLWLFDSAEN